MIIDITGRSFSGKTSGAVKLIKKDKYTVVYTQDGDFENIYNLVTGNNLYDDFGDKIKIYMISHEINYSNIVDDFLNSNNEYLVMDVSYFSSTLVGEIKNKFNSSFSMHKTLILVRNAPIRYGIKFDVDNSTNNDQWRNVVDSNYEYPPLLLNVLVKTEGAAPHNLHYMVAHYVPKFTEEYHGIDDWYDYDEVRDMNFIKEGWYANTTYIGDDVSSYFIEEKIIGWKYIT